MNLYDRNGNPLVFETPAESFQVNVKNTGYETSPTSFFGAEKTITGDGTARFIALEAIGYPITKLGSFLTYVCVKVSCSVDCTIRLYNHGSISEGIIFSDTPVSQLLPNTIYTVKAKANQSYYLYGVHDKTTQTSGASRAFSVSAEFDTNEESNGATLNVSKGVCFDVTEVFGSGNELDADTISILLSAYEDYYFTDEINLWNEKVINALTNRRQLASQFYDSYVRLTDDKNVEIGGDINPDWDNWDLTQYNYGNNPKLCPIPTMVHGKLMTDAQVSVVPIYSHWGRKAVTVGAGMWGGHVFHGWNDCQTFRLTMMASGGMTAGTVEDFVPREDEFCLHVFSPTGAMKSPIGMTAEEANHRVVPTNEDTFSGSAYYGRLRIGADKADEGFLFQCKRMTAFGLIDMNGEKLLLGDQTENVPASSTTVGELGQMAYDENYFYVCTAENTWKRFALETW